MIENFNDLLQFGVIIGIVVYFLYQIIKAISYKRLAKHIRDEEKYYKNWDDNNLEK